MECKAMYNSGLRVYLLDNYNWIDFIVLSVYLSSYVLRFLVDHRIKMADLYYNGTARAREALLSRNEQLYNETKDSIFSDHRQRSYFMKACECFLVFMLEYLGVCFEIIISRALLKQHGLFISVIFI